MTLTAAAPQTIAPSDARLTTWTRVDSGFYVGSRAGEFVGSVDTTGDGHFIAFDSMSSPIGRFETLKQAKAAATTWRAPHRRAAERHLSRVLAPIATAAGIVAGLSAMVGAVLSVSI